jgi:hypothetical protein
MRDTATSKNLMIPLVSHPSGIRCAEGRPAAASITSISVQVIAPPCLENALRRGGIVNDGIFRKIENFSETTWIRKNDKFIMHWGEKPSCMTSILVNQQSVPP